MSQHRLAPAIVVILSGVVAALHIGKIPPAIPVLRDALGMSLIEAGFLLSMVQLAGMTCALFIGGATDSLGLRRSILIGQAILATASLAGLLADSSSMLLALRAAEGFGFLFAVLPAPSLIRQLVPLNRLAWYLGLWTTYMATGMSLALLFAPMLMPIIGWQGWWAVLGLFSALSLLLVGLRVPSDGQRQPAAQGATGGVAWRRRIAQTLRCLGPWRVALAFAMYSSQWLAVIGFLPAVYAQAGWQGAQVGLLTALTCLSNVGGNVLAGRLLHRGVLPAYLLYAGFAAMALTTCLAFAEFTASQPLLRYLAVIVFSTIGGLIPSTLFALAVQVAPSEETVSTTVGWMQQCSSTGQFLAAPIVAWLAAQAGGWHWTWLFTGLASLGGLLLARQLQLAKPRSA